MTALGSALRASEPSIRRTTFKSKPVWPPNDDVRRWIGWVEGDLFQAVFGLVQLHEIWTGYNELLGTMPLEARQPGFFHSWAKNNYVTSLALGIRRLCDSDARTISLARLLGDIVQCPASIERDLWIGIRRGYFRDDSLDGLWEEWGGGVGTHLDPQVPLRDHCQLLEGTRAIKTYVDKHVAHLDANRQDFEVELTFADLHNAFQLVYDTYRRYHVMLTAASLADLAIPEWKGIFRIAWAPPEA